MKIFFISLLALFSFFNIPGYLMAAENETISFVMPLDKVLNDTYPWSISIGERPPFFGALSLSYPLMEAYQNKVLLWQNY